MTRTLLGLATASMLALTLAAPVPARAEWGGSAKGSRRASLKQQAHKLGRRVAALGKGTFVTGPLHTFESIKKQPRLFATLLGGFAAGGALLQVAGVDPEPFMWGASITAGLLQLHNRGRAVLHSHGPHRYELIGAEMVWPVLLIGGTGLTGHMIGNHPAGQPLMPGDLSNVPRGVLQTSVLVSDAPVIFMGAKQKRHHPPKANP